jgi:hypothetical protein
MNWRAPPPWHNTFLGEKTKIFVGRFTQLLGNKEIKYCKYYKVFVENSYKQPGLGFPFGYIKISTSSTVTLYVMPYNYPELLTLLTHAKDPKETATAQFQQKFDKYLKTVPGYYNSVKWEEYGH